MSRWVEPKRATMVASDASSSEDEFLARLAKYVPAEILTAYTALYGILSALQTPDELRRWAAVGLIAVFAIVTLAYVRGKAPTEGQKNAHAIVSPIAFLALAYPIASTALADWYEPLVMFAGQVLVAALSFFVKPPVSD